MEDPSGGGKGAVTKSLDMELHGLDRTLTIGEEKLDLSKGNLMIIRLNTDWVPSTTQVPGQLDERAEPDQVIKRFKAALPGDELTQALRLG